MMLAPTTDRTAASAALWMVFSSRSALEYRNFRASETWYCTLKSIAMMFSSRVSIETLSETERTWVVSTLVTVSIGLGALRWKPGGRIRENWPKRSTTPTWRASITV